jgi:acetyl esterase/lipase
MKKVGILLLIIITALLLFNCSSKLPIQYDATEKNEIIFKTVGDIEVGLDILYPTNRIHERNPTVIVLHGGGWISGSSSDFYRDFKLLCNKLRENGIAVVGVDYRLAVENLTWRDCLEDCEDALSYLIEHADEYDIDPDNIGIIGYSAGAQLALLTSIETGGQVKYCVSLSGPTTFTLQRESIYYTEMLDYYVGLAFGDDIHLDLSKASSVVRINRKCKSDFLMVNGLKDEVVPAAHAELFQREAESFGINVEVITPELLSHSYTLYPEYARLCEIIADRVISKLS